MKLIKTPFEGLFIIESPHFKDQRGEFQKLFNADFFALNGLESDFKEFYYSVNHKGVIRGMHFQTPPCDHAKLVYVTRGEILDVVVDIRKESPTYKQHFKIELSESNGLYIYIPRGFAHGFASLQDGTIVNYAQTSCYAKENDCGIRYDSCAISWPLSNPITSGRDTTFPLLSDFNSPF